MYFISILILLFSFSGACFASESENELFDSHRLKPQELLLKEYKASQLLMLGFTYHSNRQHIDHLIDLLNVVGSDPKLKYIVIERAGDLSQFYELLSVYDLKSTMKIFKFKDEAALKRSLCLQEWAYAIDKLFPVLRKINKNRPHPILVKTVDSMRSNIEESWPSNEKTILDGSCSRKEIPSKVPYVFALSTNRESETAVNFYNEIWSHLRADEKAIVLYNRGHLLTSFKGCTPQMLKTDLFESSYADIMWSDYFFKLAPAAQEKTNLVVFDEKWDEIKDGTTFKFSERQSKRYPGEDWAVNLTNFTAELPETGLDMMGSTSDFRVRLSSTATSKPLHEIASGLIWNARAHSHYSLRGLSGADFDSTREYCSK